MNKPKTSPTEPAEVLTSAIEHAAEEVAELEAEAKQLGAQPETPFQARKARWDAEMRAQRSGSCARVFYEPTFTANGHLDPTGKFIPHGVPEGFEIDLSAWDGSGSAPLKEIANG